MKPRYTAPIMRRVVREIETRGHTELFDYLTAFQAASAVMGEKIPGPFGQHVELRLLAIGLASAVLRSGDCPPVSSHEESVVRDR